MSLPCVIGRTGVQRIVKQRMSDSERESMEESAQKLFETYVQFETGIFKPSKCESDYELPGDQYGDHRDCFEHCTCLEKCKTNQIPLDESCESPCCPGIDRCTNSMPHTVHKLHLHKLRGSGEVSLSYRNMWNKYLKNLSLLNNSALSPNGRSSLRAHSRFQGLIEAQESAACQSNISQDLLIFSQIIDSIDNTTLTDTSSQE